MLALRTLARIGLLVLVTLRAGAAPDPGPLTISKGGYQLTLPDGWKVAESKPGVQEKLAERFDAEGAKIADIFASALDGTAEKESAEMAQIDEKEKEHMRLELHGTNKTAAGVEFIAVLLQLAVKDPDLGVPIYFLSLYYPVEDGGSVTFKVRCGADRIKELMPEFTEIGKTAKFVGVPKLPVPRGAQVKAIEKLVGNWDMVALDQVGLDPVSLKGSSLQISADGSLAGTMRRGGDEHKTAGTLVFKDGVASMVFGDESPSDQEIWLDGDQLVIRDRSGENQLRLKKAE